MKISSNACLERWHSSCCRYYYERCDWKNKRGENETKTTAGVLQSILKIKVFVWRKKFFLSLILYSSHRVPSVAYSSQYFVSLFPLFHAYKNQFVENNLHQWEGWAKSVVIEKVEFYGDDDNNKKICISFCVCLRKWILFHYWIFK